MDADAELKRLAGPVSDREPLHLVEHVQCHGRDLPSVSVTVPHRQTAHHHVRVSYSLHLQQRACSIYHLKQFYLNLNKNISKLVHIYLR